MPISIADILSREPNALNQLHERGRCWISSSKVEYNDILDALKEAYGRDLAIEVVAPDYEAVFYDRERVDRNEVLEIAKERSQWRKNQFPPTPHDPASE